MQFSAASRANKCDPIEAEMEFRQRGNRDERRRRVLMDESRDREGGASAAESAQSATGPRRSYSEAALESRQPALTCVVPKRFYTLTVLFLSGLVLISAIAALHTLVLQSAPMRYRHALHALDAARPGGISQWLAALLIAGGALYASVAFHLRRHKLDDYRGRYRVWIAAAIGLVAASLDAATGIHEFVTVLMVDVTGTRLVGDGSIWWLLLVGGAFALLAARLVVEMRQSRLALACSLAAATLYGVGIGFELNLWPGLKSHPQLALYQNISLLTAHLCVLMTTLSYCRYVYLDAQGKLRGKRARRRAKPTKVRSAAAAGQKKVDKRKAATAERSSSAAEKKSEMPKVKVRPSLRVDSAHKSPSPATSKTSETEAEVESTTSEQGGRKLSKAERRRQRKLLKQQNRE